MVMVESWLISDTAGMVPRSVPELRKFERGLDPLLSFIQLKNH